MCVVRFELGVLTLGVGQATVVVANATARASLFDLELWSASPQLTIGRNFTGCLLQGAGTEFTSSFALHTGVQWDSCPLPDGTDCSEYPLVCLAFLVCLSLALPVCVCSRLQVCLFFT